MAKECPCHTHINKCKACNESSCIKEEREFNVPKKFSDFYLKSYTPNWVMCQCECKSLIWEKIWE